MQPGGEVRCFADDRLLLRRAFADQIADDHQPGGDPDARLQLDGFDIKATNGVGTGPASSASNAIVPSLPPSAPYAVKAASGSTTSATGPLSVSFRPGAANGTPITNNTATCTSSNGGATGNTYSAPRQTGWTSQLPARSTDDTWGGGADTRWGAR